MAIIDNVTIDKVAIDNVNIDNVNIDNVNSDSIDIIDHASIDNVTTDKVAIDNVNIDAIAIDNVNIDNVNSDSIDSIDHASIDNVTTDKVAIDNVNIDNVNIDNVNSDSIDNVTIDTDNATIDNITIANITSTDATSTDATSTDATSTDATSTDATSTDATSTDATSHDATSTDATSTDATSTDATSTDATYTDANIPATISTDATSTDATSTDATSTDATSTDATSTDATSTDATSTDATSTDATSTDATSTDATSTHATSTDATSTDANFTRPKVLRIVWFAPSNDTGVPNDTLAECHVSALKLSVDKIQRVHKLLSDIDIKIQWYDSGCDMKKALASTVDAACVGVYKPDLILGPPCSAALMSVALLASHWNIPIFSWMSSYVDLRDRSTYTTLVNAMMPLASFVSNSVPVISKMFSWSRYVTVFDSSISVTVRSVINSRLAGHKLYIPASAEISATYSDGAIAARLLSIKQYARIFLFVLPSRWMDMRRYLLIASRLNMTGSDYAYIVLDDKIYLGNKNSELYTSAVWKNGDSNDPAAREAFENIIHVVRQSAGERSWPSFLSDIHQQDSRYSPNWSNLPPSSKTCATSVYIYETLLIWAELVEHALHNNFSAGNGAYLLNKARSYTTNNHGITKKQILMDEHADRLEGVYLLDMIPDGSFREVIAIDFRTADSIVVTYPGVIRWAGGNVGVENAPLDTPPCGFGGERCTTTEMTLPLEPGYRELHTILPIVLCLVLTVCVLLVVYLHRVNRRKRLERSTGWKVDSDDIELIPDGSFTAPTCTQESGGMVRRVESLAQADYRPTTKRHRSSGESELGDVWDDVTTSQHAMYAPVAFARGQMVAVKFLSRRTINCNRESVTELNHLLFLKHPNVCAFVGACVEPGKVCLLWEYCYKGSVQDIICNENIKLDSLFKFGLCQDIAKGLEYIHRSAIGYHGNLKSTNCVIESRWTCKVTDFGVPCVRAKGSRRSGDVPVDANAFLWTAPEILRSQPETDRQKCDIYSLGVVMKEVFCGNDPYTEHAHLTPSEILDRVRSRERSPPFRPSLENTGFADVSQMCEDCWNEDPKLRPSASRLVKTLYRINPNSGASMIDNMLSMLEKYANNLEELVTERTRQLDEEKSKTEDLLYKMIPRSVAEDLKMGKAVEAELFDDVTVYFSDIVGFTAICAESTPLQVVGFLNALYTLFDGIVSRYDVYKVETIGDAYMLVSGLPQRNGAMHTHHICDCALHLIESVGSFRVPHMQDRVVQIRVGIHSGPVVAGVVGLTMPRYCLFGDTVNTASRMESNGLPMRIHLSPQTASILDQYHEYRITCRGEIPIKGKGNLTTFFLDRKEAAFVCSDIPSSPVTRRPRALHYSIARKPSNMKRQRGNHFGNTNRSIRDYDRRREIREVGNRLSIRDRANTLTDCEVDNKYTIRDNGEINTLRKMGTLTDHREVDMELDFRENDVNFLKPRDSRSSSFGVVSQYRRYARDVSPCSRINETPITVPLQN